MNSNLLPNLIRFILLLLLQVLVLKDFSFSFGTGKILANTLVYPLFILFLPFDFPRWAMLFLAFLMGFMVDVFYDSLGVHASALVFTALVREFVLDRLEPREGYAPNFGANFKKMGLLWFFRYASILMVIHLFFYCSVEAFTFAYFFDIILKTIFSYFTSMVSIMMIVLIFKPKG